ncbi:RRP12-like protein [Cryptosporidium felis]|nr:RRP12-like protein [Cryptosporidium felis]
MDPLILEVEATLESLSARKDSYLAAYQGFLIIKESIIAKSELCSIPNFISLAFETIHTILLNKDTSGSSNSNPGEYRMVTGLFILLKNLLEVLDMNILGVNYSAVSNVIIKQLVDIMVVVSKNEGLKTDILHLTSALKQLCSVVDGVRLSPNIFMNLIEILIEGNLPSRQKADIQAAIISLLNISQDHSLTILSIQKLVLFYTSTCGKRQLEPSQGLSSSIHEQLIKPTSELYFALIRHFTEDQVKEYLGVLLQFSTLKQYRYISIPSLDCIKSRMLLFEKEDFSSLDLFWIPLYTLDGLINNIRDVRDTKDVAWLYSYLDACVSCLTAVINQTGLMEAQILRIQGSIDDFVHILKQLAVISDSGFHTSVLNSLFELIIRTKKFITECPDIEKNIENFELFESIVSRIIPLCTHFLEDYRYKLSRPELIRLLILTIESWDELVVAKCYFSENSVPLLVSKRKEGVCIFGGVIGRCLEMASIALNGGAFESQYLEYSDISNLKEELRRIVGSITRAFGPKLVLEHKPFSFEGIELTDPKFLIKSNSWLLPLLRVHIMRTELSFFIDHFLPIALKLNKHYSELQETEQNHARLYRIIEEQIWALLPGFFDEPIDFNLTFGPNEDVLKKYMIQLLDRPTTRDHICNALVRISRQTFISRGLALDDKDDVYEAQKMCNIDNRKYYIARKTWVDNAQALSAHSKTFLSLLVVKFLNSHSEDIREAGQNSIRDQECQYYLTCIQNLVPFCDNNILQSNLENFYSAWDNLARSVEYSTLPFSCGKIIALLDVAIVMLKRIQVEKVRSTLASFTRLLKVLVAQDSKKTTGEKSQLLRKLYKGLRVGLDTLKTRTRDFSELKENLVDLWRILILDSGNCPVSSLKHRLSCLRVFVQIFNKIEDKDFVFRFGTEQIINSLIPEILFCIREPNSTVRINAMTLLKSLIESYIESRQFLESVIVKMITLSRISLNKLDGDYLGGSCIISLSKIIFDFGDLMQEPGQSQDNSLLNLILSFISHSLNSRDPLIYLNSLKCIKVSLYRLNPDLLWEFVPQIISNTLENQHCALKFRIQVRKTLISVIKKFGSEKTLQLFPTQHAQLHRYLTKKLRRPKKKALRGSENIFRSIMDYGEDLGNTGVTEENSEGGGLEFLEEYDFSSDEDFGNKGRKAFQFNGKEDYSGFKQALPRRGLTIVDDSTGVFDPIDLLSSEASSKVVNINPIKTKGSKHPKERDEAVKFDPVINKIVINEDLNSERKDEFPNGTFQDLQLSQFGDQGVQLPNKASREINRIRNHKFQKKQRKQHITVKSAKEFKSKKGRGDVFKDGVQPFAYLRLNPALSKEKHKIRATKSISTMFNKKK